VLGDVEETIYVVEEDEDEEEVVKVLQKNICKGCSRSLLSPDYSQKIRDVICSR
jgi:hypothetical protein